MPASCARKWLPSSPATGQLVARGRRVQRLSYTGREQRPAPAAVQRRVHDTVVPRMLRRCLRDDLPVAADASSRRRTPTATTPPSWWPPSPTTARRPDLLPRRRGRPRRRSTGSPPAGRPVVAVPRRSGPALPVASSLTVAALGLVTNLVSDRVPGDLDLVNLVGPSRRSSSSSSRPFFQSEPPRRRSP